ncbi:MAG TPA: type II secretion system secretin GspD [Candidatus Acidoferrales bacterium]|nr:type II secretion system secretin GspD [Candidatus Acidoferrales bacterium]
MTESLRRRAGLLLILFLLMLQTPFPVGAAEPVTLNFQEADLAAVIETVGRITGRNFVVDPRVKGRVTVVSPGPLTPAEVYQIFLSVLEVNGYAAVDEGAVTKIVPDVNARQSGTPVRIGATEPAGAGLVTQVVPLRYIPAAQLVPVLRPLVPQNGLVAAYADTNTLIISDLAANVGRLVEIVRSLDRPTHNQQEVVALTQASAGEVARALKALAGEGAAGQVVADERTNSVILSGDAATRARLRQLVQQLDGPRSAGSNTYVAALRYARAEQVAPIIANILGGSLAGKTGDGAAPAVPAGTDKARVQAYPATNAVVITASPDQIATGRSVIEQLDIRRPQVMVEALIVEVSADRSKEIGVQWAISGIADGSGPAGLINFANSGLSLGTLATAFLGSGTGGDTGGTGAAVAGLGTGGSSGTSALNVGDGGTLAIGKVNGSGTDWAVLLRALLSDTDTNILSTPTLLTLDNEEAEIVVAQTVPFLTGQFTNTGAGNSALNPFQTIDRQDVGLTLKVKPQINEDGTVLLAVEQEVASVEQASKARIGAVDVVTNKRAIKTNVLVDNGATIVLGGLIDDQLSEGQSRVPGLASIPVLGALFRFDNSRVVKRNLMVFLRPTVLLLAQDNVIATHGKYQAIREQQLRLREQPMRKPTLLPEVAPGEEMAPIEEGGGVRR